MNADKLVFDLAMEAEGSPNIFIKKDWLNILDNQNGQYSSNQSVIDTSQLSNSNRYISYREGYLAIPMLLSVSSQIDATNGVLPANASGTSADYAFGLKNWFGSIIHSLSLDLNGTTIIQQTPFCNMWNSFKLMTSLSWNDVITQGASMGFYPDDPLSFSYVNAISPSGCGVSNNTNFASNAYGTIVSANFNSYGTRNGNIGFLKRQQYINYDEGASVGPGTLYSALLPATSARTLWKSYILNKQTGVNTGAIGLFQIAIMSFVQLKHLHSFFNSVPLLKGVFMKMTLTLNNTTAEIVSSGSGAAGTLSLTSVSNAVGGVCPFMVASKLGSNGSEVAIGAGTIRVNLSVGSTCLDSLTARTGTLTSSYNNIYLYVPAYSFSPVFENAYLSSPIKTIKYTDIYQYQVQNISALNGQINSLITNGLANIKSVLCLPFFSATTTGGTGNQILGAAAGLLPAYQSPYDPAGCGPTSPLSLLTNYNVVVSGQNMLYNTQRWSFEAYINNLYGANAVNGGETDGLTSGLFNQLGFEMEYCYHYVDCSRMLPVEENVPKSVQIIGTNTSAKALDLMVFIEYGVSVSVDVLTGARV